MTKIIVVGAGFGGLAAAIRLLAAGYDVTVVEALERPGGRAGWLELGPYRFDTGPTLVTLPSLFEELCRLAGTTLQDEVELIPLRPAYRILFSDGKQFDYWGDAERDAEEIARFDPTAVGTYRAFIATTRHIYERAFGDLARRPFDRLPLFLRVLPELIRLRAHESVYQFVSRYFREPHLRMVFSFHPLFIGGNPLRASAIYSIVPYLERLEGVYFARGGMRSLVDLLTRLLTRLGGELLLGTPVEQLRVDPLGRIRGVILANGRELIADAVVVNADIARTVVDLLPPDTTTGLRRWIRHARYSMSCYLLYAGVARQYSQLAHHTIIMPLDYVQQLRELFDGPGTLSELAFYLHAPAQTDSSFAPPGHESLYILVPVPHLGRPLSNWSNDAREAFRQRVLTTLEYVHGFTNLQESLQVWDEWTPIEFDRIYRSMYGAAFAFEPTLFQSAYFRPHNRSGLPGLYFVGAGTHPGAGIPGVLLSAAVTSSLILSEMPAEVPSKAVIVPQIVERGQL